MPSILVTGAVGHVGRELVLALVGTGVRVVAADYRDGRIRAELGPGLGPELAPKLGAVRLDFHDRATWAGAVAGIDHLFLVRPPAIADVEHNLIPFVEFARTQGVEHVVFLSVAGAGENKLVPHRKVEDHLRAAGDRHTNLRPGFFAQNLESAYRADIVEDDRIYVPAGRAPVNWIDVRDIAEVAASILRDPIPHRGQAYTLTGPAPVPWTEVCETLSQALGRTIRYQPASLLGYVRQLRRRGLPSGAIAVQTILHFLLRFGQGAGVDPTLERLLGRPGRSVHDYIREHAAIWRADEPADGPAGPAQGAKIVSNESSRTHS